MNIQNDKMKSDYFVQNYETDPQFFRSFSRIRKNGTRYVQRYFKDLDIHHGIFIDIFPFDSVYDRVAKENYRIKKLQILRKLNVIKHFGVDKKSSKLKKSMQKFIAFIIPDLKFNRYITKVNTQRNQENLEYLCHLTDYINEEMFRKWLIKEHDLLNLTEVEFEGYKFLAVQSYDKILKKIYGDYMVLPPFEDRIPHHQVVEIKTNAL